MSHPYRIGVSGWTYAHWRGGRFYPPGLPQRAELDYAARRFNALEINGTFYGTQTPDAFARWAEQVPRDFLFAVKGHRFITHLKQLRDVELPLANFFASGVLRLGRKLGPILWQLPARMAFDALKIERFLALLPRDTRAAARLAERHEPRVMKRGVWLTTDARRRLHHAIEVRHPSFLDPRFFDLMREHGVAVAASDAPGWPLVDAVTADIAYARLHGGDRLYRSAYSDEALDGWAERIRGWDRPAFVFFDNTDGEAPAAADALRLAERLAAPPPHQAKRRRAGKAA